MKRSTRKKLIGTAFVSPWIIGFIIFTLYPFWQTILYSFSKVRFLANGVALDFVKLDNFANVLFVDPEFKLKIPEYLKQIAFLVPMIIVFSIILALLLNSDIKFRRTFRAIFFLPVILMSGPVLKNLMEMGATNLNGVTDFFVYTFIQQTFPSAVGTPILYIFESVVLFLWFSGVQILIFLSGLQKVNGNIYEAAMVDGASKWQQFWKITMPTIKPFIFLNTIYTIVDISNSSLNPFTEYIKLAMFKGDKGFGFSAAATWVYFALIVLAVIVAYVLLGREEKPKKKKNYITKQSMEAAKELKRITA